MSTEELNKVLKDLLGISPLDGSDKVGIDRAQLDGLAKMYSDMGFRLYLGNQIKKAIYDAAILADDEKKGAFLKGRLLTLKELLGKSKQAFEDLGKLKNIENANNEKRKENS